MSYPLALALAAAACSQETSPISPSPDTRGRIVVLGDSLAVSPSVDLGFPAVLQQRLDQERLLWTIVNSSFRGDTTSDGRDRVQSVLSTHADILILALGANDGLRGADPAAIRRNLAAIVEAARARSVRVLLCGMETPPLRGWDYMLAFHRIFPDLAAQYRIGLVPFLLDGVALNPELNEPDLVHPNAAGARQIAATVWPFLLPLIQEATRTQVR